MSREGGREKNISNRKVVAVFLFITAILIAWFVFSEPAVAPDESHLEAQIESNA